MSYIYASICSSHPYFYNNNVFNINFADDEYSILEPFIALKKYLFENYNCILNTIDINKSLSNKEVFRLYLDPDNDELDLSINNFAILVESKLVKPQYNNKNHWLKYNKIFTWDLSLVDNAKFIHQPIPFFFKISNIQKERGILISAIAANKNLHVKSKDNLYQLRLELFKFFNNKKNYNFQLYGRAWGNATQTNNKFNLGLNKFVSKVGINNVFGKIYHHIFKDVNNIYKGNINNKYDILLRSFFNIAFENSYGDLGYITEKIFQPMVCGCIPVYFGSKNISEFVPSNSYIDFNKFNNFELLYNFINSLNDSDILEYVRNGQLFINSDNSKIFKSDFFCRNIAQHVF